MVIIPIAHERQTVQRLPWITFSLIALNIIIHLAILIGSDNSISEPPEEATRFFEYLSEHPYLEIPESMKPFIDEEELETLDLMKEGFTRSEDLEAIQAEQEELNRLARAIQDWMNSNPLRRYGYIPAEPEFLSLITCMFLHTGFFHLIGNMLFLFLAGCSLEDLWGRPLYTAFYLLSGIAATLVHQIAFPQSEVPIVGASGAIAGLMGAFLFRLARTKIRFLYIIWAFIAPVKMGTFEAPAYVMLPLWLAEQILYAFIMDGSAGVAFWAHIGGFIFGFAFAAGMKSLEIEEKYIAPKIEQKVSLKQNPLFLKAIQSIEKGDHASAFIMLKNVIQKEPEHLEAYMELRRICQVIGDKSGYLQYTGGMLERLIRSKDYDLLLETAAQFKESNLYGILPARTLYAMASFYEEQRDTTSALEQHRLLAEHYQSDPLALKSHSRMARIFIAANNKTKAIEALRESYQHPMADESWKRVVEADLRKYNISLNEITDEPHAGAFDQPGGSAEEGSSLTVHSCILSKITLQGIVLIDSNKNRIELSWKEIAIVSTARIQNKTAPENVLIDWILQGPERTGEVYRLNGGSIDFQSVFKGVEQTFDEALHNFLGIVAMNSKAKLIPGKIPSAISDLPYYATLPDYERSLKVTPASH